MGKRIMLRPDMLQVDHSYQRDELPAHIARIAANLDERMLQTPVVSRRADDTYWLLDGQQRCCALIMAGLGAKKIWCEVQEGLTIKDEARIYYVLNRERIAQDAFGEFKARLKFDDPPAVAIQAIVRGLDLRIANAVTKGTVRAIRTVEFVHLRYGNLEQTLSILRDWHDSLDGNAATFDQVLIKDLGWFLLNYPDATAKALLLRLKGYTPEAVKNKITYCQQVNPELAKLVAASHIFRQIYNRKNRKKLPLKPQD